MKCKSIYFSFLSFLILWGLSDILLAQTILFSPDSLYMGRIPVGSVAERQLIVYNTGTTTMNISKIEISGDAGGNFKITNNPGTATLRQLQSVTLNIRYTPANSNSNEANIVITSNASTSPDKLYLYGSGVADVPVTFERIFGDEGSVRLNSVQQTSDGGYVLAGSILLPSEDFDDFYIVKTDADGFPEWKKVYGFDGTENAFSVLQKKNGDYLVLGRTDSEGAGRVDYYLMELDSQGNKVWDKTYGGSKDDFASWILETSDGNYFLIGTTTSFSNGISTDAYIIKINSTGDVIWEKHYGGSGGDSATRIIRTRDGNYVILGSTTSSGSGSFDVWLFKIDENGNMLWEKTFGGNAEDEGNDIVELSDGGFAICGYTLSYGAGAMDMLLIKTDAKGNQVWMKTYGGIYQDVAKNIVAASDRIIVAGIIHTSIDESALTVIKTDFGGNEVLRKTYGKKGERSNEMIINNDGHLVIAGESSSYSSKEDAYLLNVSDFSKPNSVEGELTSLPGRFQLYRNYPNPFNSQTQISFSLDKLEYVELNIFNIHGEKVGTLLTSNLSPGYYRINFNASGLPSGVYFAELVTPSNRQVQKMMLIK